MQEFVQKMTLREQRNFVDLLRKNRDFVKKLFEKTGKKLKINQLYFVMVYSFFIRNIKTLIKKIS